MPFLWIFVTVAASGLQVARNAAQRGLIGDAGPWGATLVRFLFGLPFSIVFLAGAWSITPHLHPHPTPAYFGFALTGAATQVLATSSMLVAMRRAGFAVGTAMQQSSLPLAAVLGWAVFHDRLSATAWAGVTVTTVGLLVLTWPRGAEGSRPISGGAFGLASGLCFGFSLNAYRHAAIAFEPAHALFSAVATVTLTQALQSLVLVIFLAWRHPWALRAVGAGWRRSLVAGVCGSCASAAWLFALALAPAAGHRRDGRRLFKERLTLVQWIASLVTAGGVLVTALG